MINKFVTNIVVGKPITEEWQLLALDKNDWEEKEKFETIWVEDRFLPDILTQEIKVKHFNGKNELVEDTVKLNVFPSKSQLRKNRPDLCLMLDKLDFLELKIGKKRFWIVVGE